MSDFFDLRDRLTSVPQEVVLAARTVRRWVDTHIPNAREVSIHGVGVRTFLSVHHMLIEKSPESTITELKVNDE